jgi:hypothetical protein
VLLLAQFLSQDPHAFMGIIFGCMVPNEWIMLLSVGLNVHIDPPKDSRIPHMVVHYLFDAQNQGYFPRTPSMQL